MATEINIKRNGAGPYKYIVTYENGEHHWDYVGKASEHEDGAYVNDDGSLTNKGKAEVSEVKTPSTTKEESETQSQNGEGQLYDFPKWTLAKGSTFLNGEINRIRDGNSRYSEEELQAIKGKIGKPTDEEPIRLTEEEYKTFSRIVRDWADERLESLEDYGKKENIYGDVNRQIEEIEKARRGIINTPPKYGNNGENNDSTTTSSVVVDQSRNIEENKADNPVNTDLPEEGVRYIHTGTDQITEYRGRDDDNLYFSRDGMSDLQIPVEQWDDYKEYLQKMSDV